MRDPKLDNLFEPLEMKNLFLKNRFYMAPMATRFDPDQLTDYFVARAKGGVALITTAATSVHPSGRGDESGEMNLETDDAIAPMIPLVKAVQKAGAKIVAQPCHVGRYAFSKKIGQQSVSSSDVASRYTGETPRALSTEEADDMVMAFAQAGLRARKAGFDGVEILGSSGYLISQFLSPLTNKRTDKYGGDARQRTTFFTSIIKETRKLVGEDFNICVKFDGDDGMKGGMTLEDALMLAPLLVEAGADRLHVWAGWHEASRPMLPMFVKRGAFSYLAGAIRNVVDVPVSAVGRINDPYVAAGILERGEADLIGLGRTLLCDPEFVNKTRDGRVGELRKCIACCHCFEQLMLGLKGREKTRVKCALNAELGHEGEDLLKPASQKKKVVVVGAGPAGLEAARVAAVRGHQVTLFEEDTQLGGMINLAHIPPFKSELKNIIDYYTTQMETLPVDVRLGTTFTADMLSETNPDVLVLAAGARETLPPIPGIEGRPVFQASDALTGSASIGGNVVVIGGGLIGVETAEFLADQGKDVTIIEMLPSIASDVDMVSRWGLISRLKEKTTILTSTEVVQVKEGSVVVSDRENNEKEIPAESLVVATGLATRSDLVSQLKETGTACHVIGSCREAGKIAAAVKEGFETGCRI